MNDASEIPERSAEDAQDSSPEEVGLSPSDHGSLDDAYITLGTFAAGESRAKRRHGKRPKSALLHGRLSKGYIDLLNFDVERVNGFTIAEQADLLPSSQIGGSHWTPKEKSAFYTQLSLSGPGELQKLARAIGTKSEPEIRAYILLLQEGVRELQATSKRQEPFSFADVSAAYEVSAKCEQAADVAADTLSKRLQDADAKREQEKFGEWWLIDQDVAEVVEECFDDFEPPQADDSGPSREPSNSTDDEDAAYTTLQPCEEVQGVKQPDLPFPAAQLLIPTAFLRLSSNLFMNSAADSEENWHNLVDEGDPQPGPAMYQTAFGDFHNLTVSLTRRLVQVSIFQAMTRLRASDDNRLLPNVTGTDVKAALKVLGINIDRKKYWSTAPRRCGVHVYSDSKEFRDGRTESKMGLKLSFDEVEAKLGLDKRMPTPGSDEETEVADSDVDALQNDSDAYTDAESSHYDYDVDGVPSAMSGDDNEDTDVSRRGRASKRKRALSPRSYDCADDRTLEAIDRIANLSGENHLRDILGLDLLPESEHPPPPERSYKRLKAEPRPIEWRDRVEYEAPWEQYGIVDSDQFDSMEADGAKGRKRREMLRQAVRKRLSKNSGRKDESSSSEEEREDASDDGSLGSTEGEDKDRSASEGNDQDDK